MGVATGSGCKEVYRFSHTTYPYSSCICSFLQQHPYFLLNVFVLVYIYIYIEREREREREREKVTVDFQGGSHHLQLLFLNHQVINK